MALSSNIKPVVLAQTAASVVEASIVIPNLMTKVGIDEFRGASSDTVNVKVPGVLPAHDLAWRTERTADITLDAYSERTMAVSFQGNVYQATKLQDEQVDFDYPDGSWQRVVPVQAQAVARHINMKSIDALKAPAFPGNASLSGVSGNSTTAWSYTIAGNKSGRNLRGTLLAVRRVANAIQMDPNRTLVISPYVEQQILGDTNALGMASAMVGGDAVTVPALREATIGKLFGMNIVVANDLADNEAYLITPQAFVMATAAPAVPQSVPFGATASTPTGIAVRWMRDYDALRYTDRSSLNTYVGFRAVPDVVAIRDQTNHVYSVSTGEYFIRALKVNMTATADTLPAAGSELANAFGISTSSTL